MSEKKYIPPKVEIIYYEPEDFLSNGEELLACRQMMEEDNEQ